MLDVRAREVGGRAVGDETGAEDYAYDEGGEGELGVAKGPAAFGVEGDGELGCIVSKGWWTGSGRRCLLLRRGGIRCRR